MKRRLAKSFQRSSPTSQLSDILALLPFRAAQRRAFVWLGFVLSALLPQVALALSIVDSPLSVAQACYGRSDFACVIAALEKTAFDLPADRAEGLRLLAFAAARMDRHDLARKAFAAWIVLSDQHRLDRASTPPNVYQDYAAALLQAHKAELDLTPQLEHQPQLPAPPAKVEDLPHFAPPPRAQRDQARDFGFYFGPAASLIVLKGSTTEVYGAFVSQFAIDLDLSPQWRLGIATGAVAGKNVFGFAQLRVAHALWLDEEATLDGVVGLGVAMGRPRGCHADEDCSADPTLPLISPTLRYRHVAAASTIGWAVELQATTMFDTGSVDIAPTLVLSLAFRPPRPKVSLD